jgi:hypothetical protein
MEMLAIGSRKTHQLGLSSLLELVEQLLQQRLVLQCQVTGQLYKPMLELRIFKYDIFALTTIISMIINMAMFGAMILLPIYLQNIRGFTAFDSGLLLLHFLIKLALDRSLSLD